MKQPDTQNVSGNKLTAASIDPDEIARFSAIAETWWDPNGKMGTLHKFNPVRIAYIRKQLVQHFGLDDTGMTPLSGLTVADVGCGGGLVCAPIARLGAQVTGVDAAEKNVKTATVHAEEQGLQIDYRHATAETLVNAGELFDVVLNLEVVEHVADLPGFMADCTRLVKPGGLMVAATLNRTLKSLALAKFGAEYVLRWLPIGTHDWRKFVKPSELSSFLRDGGMTMRDMTGVAYNPLADTWSLSRDVSQNYLMVATKSAN